MRTGGRRALSVLAITAIALHAVLWGVAPLSAGPAADPFSVICHSDAAAPSDSSPADPASSPTHVCDHCNLCSATAPPAALDMVLAGRLAPVKLPQGLSPAIAVNYDGLANNPNRTRGPPHFA